MVKIEPNITYIRIRLCWNHHHHAFKVYFSHQIIVGFENFKNLNLCVLLIFSLSLSLTYLEAINISIQYIINTSKWNEIINVCVCSKMKVWQVRGKSKKKITTIFFNKCIICLYVLVGRGQTIDQSIGFVICPAQTNIEKLIIIFQFIINNGSFWQFFFDWKKIFNF